MSAGGYVGAVAAVGADDVEPFYEGAKFFSPSLGDSPKAQLVGWLAALLDDHGPVPLLRPESLAPDVRAIAMCVIGSGSAMVDLPPAGDEFVEAARRVALVQGAPFGAVFPLAAATVSALVPVAAAAQLGLPLVDADGMGRTFALIHHTSMYLAGVSPTPLVAFGPTGESVLVDVPSGPRADRVLRGNVDVLGGWAALAAYPTTAGVLRRAALPGTVSRLVNVGRLLLGRIEPDVLVQRLGSTIGARRIGRGRIVDTEHLSRPTDVTVPAHPSSLVLEETGGAGRQLRVELRSEIVAVFADGALVAAAPDLLCLLDVSRGELATLDTLEPGDVVDVMVTPADAVWYSPAGLAMVGPASHGMPLTHPRAR